MMPVQRCRRCSCRARCRMSPPSVVHYLHRLPPDITNPARCCPFAADARYARDARCRSPVRPLRRSAAACRRRRYVTRHTAVARRRLPLTVCFRHQPADVAVAPCLFCSALFSRLRRRHASLLSQIPFDKHCFHAPAITPFAACPVFHQVPRRFRCRPAY